MMTDTLKDNLKKYQRIAKSINDTDFEEIAFNCNRELENLIRFENTGNELEEIEIMEIKIIVNKDGRIRISSLSMNYDEINSDYTNI